MRIGLRLQILAAVTLLLLAAFVPLWRAIAGVTDRAHAVEAAARDREVVELYADQAERGEVLPRSGRTVCVYDHAGALLSGACTTPPPVVAERPHVVVRLSPTRPSRAATELALLYLVLFAAALLAFTFAAITWLVVRPIEALAQAAQRVARGAPELVVPAVRATEVAELGEHLRAMTSSLRENERQLAEKVEQLTKTTGHLTTARHELAEGERLASVGRLAAGVAHEIGNPLTAIFGLADLLVEGGLSPEQVRDFAGRIRKESERAHVTIRDLLDFARAQPGPEEHGDARTSLATVVATVVSLLAPQRGFRAIVVQVEVPEALHVRMAEARLTQVLVNLALNAQDAIGGEGTLRFVAETVEDRCILHVADDGPGVAAAVRERLFEPFVTTKEPGRGTGLGLAVCRSLCEAAGGSLRLEDTTKGASFRLELPLA